MDNICKFVSGRVSAEEINIVHFVYERNAQFEQKPILPSTYSLAFVTHGEGKLHTNGMEYSLTSGDIFVILAANSYYIENANCLEYIYITFVGSRAAALIDRIDSPRTKPVYHGYDSIRPLWENAFGAVTEENLDLICEGILLYTFSHLCLKKDEMHPDEKMNGILQVKRYVDGHFTDSTLNLSFLSQRFAFHPKYLSAAFKRMVRISFTEYLQERRLEYALKLIEGGAGNVREIAERCGYSDALYFSKVFKKKYALSPKQMIVRSFSNK